MEQWAFEPSTEEAEARDRMFEAALDHILSKSFISGLQNKTVLSTQAIILHFK